jgi:hypothetical protein
VRFATPAEIADLTAEGDFVLQLHLGALLLAGLQGQLDLSEFAVLR